MAQQTGLVVVRDYFARFTHLWPSVEALAAAPLDDILVEWAGLGYYARARNLHAAAQYVANELGGNFPTNAQDLQLLPGVGPYTAAAIASICYDEQIAVLDGNVDRVMARQLALPVPVRDAKPTLRAAVQACVPARAGDFAQAMMDLGATICAPRKAACDLCPIGDNCCARETSNPEIYPIKPVKPARPQRFGHAYVMRRADGAVWLRQRPEKGLLAKMTEMPGSDWAEQAPLCAFPQQGEWLEVGVVRHVFTHFALDLTVWMAMNMEEPSGGGWWVMPDDLDNQALPSLFKKVLAKALQN